MASEVKEKPKPTRTTGRLHFEDLSAERFEDLCHNLIYRHRDWVVIKHPGSAGADDGIDIYAEYIEDGIKRDWVIQCKRYQKIHAKQAIAEIDKYLSRCGDKPCDVYVLILGCKIRKKTDQSICDYAKKRGLRGILIWDASMLESILYAKHPDLVFTFFGILVNNVRSINVAKVKRRLALKKKLESSLVSRYRDPEIRKDVIIRNIDYDVYPEIPDKPGISPWFRLGFFRTYFKGVSFYVGGVVYLLVDKKKLKWSLGEYDMQVPEGYELVKAYRIGDIPYDNIVDIDMEGDEYYGFPHIYCEFNNNGEPYEKIWYWPVTEKSLLRFKEDFSVGTPF